MPLIPSFASPVNSPSAPLIVSFLLKTRRIKGCVSFGGVDNMGENLAWWPYYRKNPPFVAIANTLDTLLGVIAIDRVLALIGNGTTI